MQKLHVIDDPGCMYGTSLEDDEHYFLHCPRYNNIRYNLRNTRSQFTIVTVPILLHDDRNLQSSDSELMFGAVHIFITDSKQLN